MTARRQPASGASHGLVAPIGVPGAVIPPQALTDAASKAVVEAPAQVTFAVPDALVEAIAMRAAEMVAGHLAKPESWIGVEEAAEHIGAKTSRVYREVSRAKPGGRDPNPIPYVKDGQRLLFRRSELDAWLARGGHREE